MKQQTALLVLSITLILAAIIGCSSQRPSSQSVDEFTVEKLSEYQGKVVVLNFWAIWCPHCRTELPELEAVYRQYRDQGVVVLAVNVSESSADIIAYAQKLGLTFIILRDSRREGMRTYNIQGLPTTLFIDRQGQIKHRQVGAMTKSFVTQQIESLLD